MKAERLKSGHYRIKKWNGKDAKKKTESLTFSTKEEAERMISILKMDAAAMTVEEACEGFLMLRKDELSPSTIRGYEGTLRTYIKPDRIRYMKLVKLSTPVLQKWVNSMPVSKKSKKNNLGFLLAAVRFFELDRVFRVRISEGEKKAMYTPTIEEVNSVLDNSDDELHLAIALGCLGLRRGEICALTMDDIDFESMTIRVTKSLVKLPDNTWEVKTPKTKESNREVPLHPDIIELLPEEGRLIKSSPDCITNRFAKLVKRLDLPHFRFHDLRSFSASVDLDIGASRATVKKVHGWKTDRMLNEHYERSMTDRKKMDEEKILRFYSSNLHFKNEHKKA